MRLFQRILSLRKASIQRVGQCLLSAVLIFPCLPGAPVLLAVNTPKDVAPNHSKVAVAYAYDAKSPVFADRDAQYLTQINWSFALIVDGKVSGEHWRNIDRLLAYKRKHPHIKAVMAIGGWGADGFSQAVKTEQTRLDFVASAMNLVNQYGFDGIDIDWEYPGSSVAGIASSPDDKANLTLLLQELRKALNELTAKDGRKRLLSIATGASAEHADDFDCAAVARVVDYVNIMSYDMAGGSKTTGHHTNLYASQYDPFGTSAHAAVNAYEREGVPRQKIVLGAAFYGHMWKGVTSTEQDGFGQEASDRGKTTISYDAIVKNYYGSGNYQVFWDDAACAPFLFDGENFITYDNVESVRIKANYARMRGLGGMMYWEYSQNTSGELLKAMDAGLRGQ